ncbi:MAG: 2-dehydropantoate 2-reductase N-terminal domain-containing protein [Pedobacter sp.]|nr:2-dehydropantoate 2-reductase N-terminal domain-containing protein [Pedobacter sp.]
MQILLIGAGAVGQVYGRHLAAAGHAVSFFVKPAHRAALQDGMPLHRLGHLRKRSEVWQGYQLITELDEVAARAWDQIWICTSSDALRSPLMHDILARVGKATVVCLQPGPEDAALVREQLADAAQLVQGLITFISYQSPLPGKADPAGIAFYLPPLAPALFSGDDKARVASAVQALREGGMSARAVKDLHAAAGGADGLLIPLVAALELHDWKFSGFVSSEAFALGRDAAQETLTILAREQGARVGATRAVLNPLLSRSLLLVAPYAVPLPLEDYLHYHFSKVGVQTRQMLESYAAIGERHGLPVIRLRELRRRLS